MRIGPRPLPLHLMAVATISASSLAAWPLLSNGWRPWKGKLAKAGETLDLANANPEAFGASLRQELASRHAAFLKGLETYRSHPYRRMLAPPPALWESGPARLFDYGRSGSPVLVVPSLVNRSHVLDLTMRRSLLRYLAARGFRPLLVDWGTPGDKELGRSLDDYIARDLVEALRVANDLSGGGVPVIGYCMGGTLATALAALTGDMVSALALLAAPWDFHAATGGPPPMIAARAAALERIVSALGCLPVDVLQALFLGLDPTQSWGKFRRFAEMDPGSEEAELFVALEDWLNDGVPLAGPVARECLFGWYVENRTAAGCWRVAGTAVDPARIHAPALAVLPSQDRIVPPESAAALAYGLPAARTLAPRAGHIGMAVGKRAKTRLWSPLADWLEYVARDARSATLR